MSINDSVSGTEGLLSIYECGLVDYTIEYFYLYECIFNVR